MAPLRKGFTTGSAATAAAMAAAIVAFRHYKPQWLNVTVPPGAAEQEILCINIERCGINSSGTAFAEVRKDGGDDPDVTSGMIIRADLYDSAAKGISIEGGYGIGRATLPGLPIAVGECAINPAPKAQIEAGVAAIAPANSGLRIVISAPEGVERARRTMNGDLGILGGISILGTQGVVQPYSHAAYKASIEQAIAVALASNCQQICLATGRRSKKFLRELYPSLHEQCFVVAGDLVQDSLAMTKDFATVVWGCFFGKLVKLAQGLGNTHAHTDSLDRDFLAKMLDMPDLCGITTAQSVAELAVKTGGLQRIVAKARKNAQKFADREVRIHVFDLAGRELARI